MGRVREDREWVGSAALGLFEIRNKKKGIGPEILDLEKGMGDG